MLAYFIPLAIVSCAPLLSSASPIFRVGGAATVTLTISQSPSATSTPTSAMSFPVLSALRRESSTSPSSQVLSNLRTPSDPSSSTSSGDGAGQVFDESINLVNQIGWMIFQFQINALTSASSSRSPDFSALRTALQRLHGQSVLQRTFADLAPHCDSVVSPRQ
ncbi:hypothetical protein C8R43DRAFT_1236568 [Mycena crocata]|nr:hypothetical protein C8R43DRAFT_1236568 [Mycena crocata]